MAFISLFLGFIRYRSTQSTEFTTVYTVNLLLVISLLIFLYVQYFAQLVFNYWSLDKAHENFPDMSIFLFTLMRLISQGFPRYEAVVLTIQIASLSYFLTMYLKNFNTEISLRSCRAIFCAVLLGYLLVGYNSVNRIDSAIEGGGSPYERRYADLYLRLGIEAYERRD
jgi:hypothetical protein